jgi:hypothetical protein
MIDCHWSGNLRGLSGLYPFFYNYFIILFGKRTEVL